MAESRRPGTHPTASGQVRRKKKKTPFLTGLGNLLRYICIELGKGVYKFFLLEDTSGSARKSTSRPTSGNTARPKPPVSKAPASRSSAPKAPASRTPASKAPAAGKSVQKTSPARKPSSDAKRTVKAPAKNAGLAGKLAGKLSGVSKSIGAAGKKFTGRVNGRSKKRDIAAKAIVASFAAAFVLFALFQACKYMFGGVALETAQSVTMSENIETTGIAVRNEQIIESSEHGIIVSTVENGGRVFNGQAIANVYGSQEAALAAARIAEIDGALEDFENLSTAGEDSAAELSSLEKQLGERLLRVARGVYDGDIKGACSNENDILYLLNKSQIATKSTDGFDARIAELKEERERLAAQYTDAPRTIDSSLSGYFINEVDGYEDLLYTDILPQVTPERLDEILSQFKEPQRSTVIGKIAEDYVWYIVCEVTADEAAKLSKGKYYNISLPYSDVETVTAQLTGVNTGEDESRALMIFKCSYMVSSLSTVRRQPMSIETASATGLEVRSDCITTQTLYKYVELTSNGDLPGVNVPPEEFLPVDASQDAAVSPGDAASKGDAAAKGKEEKVDPTYGGTYIRTVSENEIKSASELERQDKKRLERIEELKKTGRNEEEIKKLEKNEPKRYAEYKKVCQGVFVRWGTEAKFRRIDVIYSSDGVSICREAPETDGYVMYRDDTQRMLSAGQTVRWLKQYDEVITRTKGIHDGQIINTKR